jgi:hypothetical protein
MINIELFKVKIKTSAKGQSDLVLENTQRIFDFMLSDPGFLQIGANGNDSIWM